MRIIMKWNSITSNRIHTGWDNMSRKRSIDKSIPISVALPSSLVRRLDQELDYTSSRSKYVAKAIENRLNEMESSALSDASTRHLMAELNFRIDISKNLKTILNTLLMEMVEADSKNSKIGQQVRDL
jgi:predicted DNA-binding protein